MRKYSMALGSLLVLIVAATALSSLAATKGTTHEATVEFVSYDSESETVRFKGEDGKETSAPVLESAAAKFAKIEPGERIVLTCADDENGNHVGVSKVRRVKESND